MNTTSPFHRTALAAAFLALAACGGGDPDGGDALPADTTADDAAAETPAARGDAPATSRSATARLSPTEGNEARGTVTFTEADDGIRVEASLTGLAEGEHGFHLHETGDCSAPDASSAGGHFAPEQSRHGGPDQQPPDAHVGDMGNLTADRTGTGSYERTFAKMAFDGERGIVGRAVIVHAGADDLTSQPSGDAGSRVACGVIEPAR